MTKEQFTYKKGKTRLVCKSCGERYKDYFFINKYFDCADCNSMAKCGFTDEKRNIEKEGLGW